MARIAGIDLPKHKRGCIGLTYIYGVGRSGALSILEQAGVDPDIKVEDWTDEQQGKIREVITENVKAEGALRTEMQLSIKRLRTRNGLPVRGQRTRTNARTRKGRRKTVANKKKATK